MKDFIKINENDNVIVALKELTAGETILAGTQEVTARETIPAGHKMAIRDIATGAEVIKYGFRIGNAKENIAAGQWVHVHNLKTALGDLLEYTYEPVETNVKKTEDVKFMGFARANGKVGVRMEKPVSEMRSGLFRRLAVSTILQPQWRRQPTPE